jgi:hypothetical protein
MTGLEYSCRLLVEAHVSELTVAANFSLLLHRCLFGLRCSKCALKVSFKILLELQRLMYPLV